MTPKENYLAAVRGEKPEWVPSFIDECVGILPGFWTDLDPETETDFCNVKWTENEYGRMPLENWQAISHISQWRDTVKFPDLDKLNWEELAKKETANCSPDKVTMGMLNTNGIFLIPVNMLGWVEALCTIYEEPDELRAFIEKLTEFMLKLAEYEIKYYKPDIICFGDDVASTTGPFISKDTWADLYKPYFQKMCDVIKGAGLIAEFHCCGNCGFFIDEFLDLGVDVCQLPEPNAALLDAKKRYGNRLRINGGWDRHGPGAMPGASEAVVRQSVRTAINDYGKDGGLVFWDGGIVGDSEDAKQKLAWVFDELHTYGRQVYK